MQKETSEKSYLNLSQEISIPLKALEQHTLLGGGGFGKVYSGTWKPTTLFKTPVAVKQLHQANFSARVLKEFEAEVTVHARLESPRIVKLFGVTLDEPYCMVMELMTNGSLDSYLQQYDPSKITWNFRIQLAQDIASGLDYLHNQKPPIIHADLKSLNVLLDGQNRAKLGDFGLASIKNESASKVQSVSQQEGRRPSGSLLWMAPELLKRGGGPSLQSDVYAYGVVLWEISTHQYPFTNDASKGTDVIREFIKDGDLDPFPVGTPESYQALGEACRSKEKDKRPSTQKILDLLGISGRQAAVGEMALDQAASAPPAYLLNSQPVVDSEKGTPYLLQTAAQAERDKRSQEALLTKKQIEAQQNMTPSMRVNRKAQEVAKRLGSDGIKDFLSHIVRGSLDRVKMYLDRNREFALTMADIKDMSDREFKQVTGFQYAYWARDVEMCELILKYLPEEAARNQILALEHERDDILQSYGLNYSLGPYIKALQKFVNNFKGWDENYKNGGKQAIAECWCLEVGGAQRGFPAWMIFLFKEEGERVAWVKQDLKVGFKRDEKNLMDYWFSIHNTHTLGGKPAKPEEPSSGYASGRGKNGRGAWYRFGTRREWGITLVRRGSHGLDAELHDLQFSTIIESVRYEELKSLRNRLFEADLSKSDAPTQNYRY